ncbi:MAG: hypothetical protein GX654_03280 [Desulfatiglans sp.]|nr:hypothetical protein [Desulfatiglans sp.]
MDFKKLNLDRNKIDGTIQECAGLDEKPKPQQKGNGYHYTIMKNGKEVKFIIYLNGDGTTTLTPAGKNTVLSIEILEFIVGRCLITEKKHFELSFKSVPDENFDQLLAFLCEDRNAEVVNDDVRTNQRIIKIKSQFSDEITLTYYSNKTVLVQGKPLSLYVDVKLFFYETLSLEEVVEKESEEYNIDIKVNDIRHEFVQLMPNAYPYLEEKVIKVITPSLSLLKLNIQLEDYSSFVFPVLKGLEGYIKQILRDKGSDNSVRFVSSLGCLFKPRIDELQDFAKLDIACDKTCEVIEKSYSYWKSKRHPYFHMDRHIEMTPILYKKEDAEAIVYETLTLIEETYSKII